MKLTTQAVSGVRWTSISSVVNIGSETFRTVFMARFLAPDDFGLMAMVWIVIGLAQMYTDLGISAAIIHKQQTTKEQLSSLYWLNIFAGLAVFGIMWLLTPWIPLFFREPRLPPLLKAVAVVFIITPIGAQFEILLQKELSFRLLAIQEIISSIGCTVVAVVLAVAGFGVWALVISFLVQLSLKALLLARIGFVRFRPAFHFRRSDLKGYIGFGFYQLGERSINFLSQRIDQILIGPLLGVRALGFYSFAFNMTGKPIWRINPILNRVAFPLFSKVQDEPDRLKRGYMKLIRLVTTINAPLLLGLAAVAPLLVPSVLGAKWTESIPLIQVMCLVSLLRCISNPIGSLQLAKGRADLGFWWNAGLFVSSIPFVLIGGKLGGAIGVAYGLLVLQIVLTVPGYFFLLKPLIGACAREYMSSVLGPISIAALMGLGVFAFSAVPIPIPMLGLVALQIFVGFLMYMALLRVFQGHILIEFRSALLSQ